MALLDDMLRAASQAAGANWPGISADMKTFAQNLIDDSRATGESYATGQISADDVTDELHAIGNEARLIEGYAEQRSKQALQDAINAAIGVLSAAITKAI